MTFKIVKLVCALAALASAVQGDAIAKRADTSPLAKRQGACDPGETLCGTLGLTSYCARPGNKCCSLFYSAPEEATCCDLGTYARPGYYCCSGGGSCPNGETCLACTPDEGSPGTTADVPSSRTSSTPLTTTPPDVTTTLTRATYEYWTFTITYYYYQFYWIYVPSLTKSTSTSSKVTTTIVTSVYASNSADARSSVEDITATASFPTPESATELPPLETSSADDESSTSSRASTTRPSGSASSAASASASASTSSSIVEFTGGPGSGQGRVTASLHGSLGEWLFTFGMLTGALCILL